MARAELGDARLTQRLVRVIERLADSPGASFPEACSDDAELEGLYRFMSNERVTWKAILRPHMAQTVSRCERLPAVVVVHDSTEVWLRGEDDAREGLGHLSKGHRGFHAHMALAVSADEHREPLGVLGMVPLVTPAPEPAASRSEQERRYRTKPPEERKSERWRTLVEETSTALAAHPNVVHVADSEADDYRLWAGFIESGRRFVIRGYVDRPVLEGTNRLQGALEEVEGELLREVPLQWRVPRRVGRGKRTLPREARMATLHVRSRTVTIPRPPTAQSPIERTTLNVVQVYEPSPPEDADPIEWTLLTTEPVSSLEQMSRVVDLYRTRWTIEEYFKALKTGCSLERRQLMSLEALLNALAVLAPIAWRLLLIRSLAREEPNEQARALDADQLAALRVFSKRVKLTDSPTNEDVLLAVAGIGGHLKRNGAPGWLTLARGYAKFSLLYEGWAAARGM